jgi:hypothetical protein
MTFWEITFDGWFGAILGAGVSVGLAVYVLRTTLAADRKQFLDQLESERALAMEQRRLEAFGEVAGAIRRLLTFPDHTEARMLYGDISVAISRWRLYLDESVRTGPMLEAVALTLVRVALIRGAPGLSVTERDRWSTLLNTSVMTVVEEGRRWQAGELSADEAADRWLALHERVEDELPDELPTTD